MPARRWSPPHPRANDNAGVGSALYGPIVLAGQYGTTDLLSVNSALQTSTLKKTAGSALKFTGTASTGSVWLSPLYLTHHQRYAAYWNDRVNKVLYIRT